MIRRKRLKIGYSDFQQFIEENGYFIDKTLFIKEVIDSAYKIQLITRARRFGKTLNLSMLRYFFDITLKDKTKVLFEEYLIWQEAPYYTEQHGKHPVIFLTLKRAKALTFEKSEEKIYAILQDVNRQYKWLIKTGLLEASEAEALLKVINGTASSSQYEVSLKKLCEYLYRHYGEKTIILMDEYDAPIHTGFHYGYYDEIIGIMKSFMGETFKDNPFLHKGVITGILRIAKESIFSDFNNPGIFTTLSSAFADKFGFTELEIQKLLTYFGMTSQYPFIKQWYNGYRFADVKNIYSPWSIINYIEQYQAGFKSYWVNSSSDELIKNQVNAKDAQDIRDDIEALLKGKTITKFLNENITFSDFETDQDLFWSLLFFSGYLTLDKIYNDGFYGVKIPNYEVRLLFKRMIRGWLKTKLKIRTDTLMAMAQSLVNNKIPTFKKHFKTIMKDTFSYFDTDTEPERVYQAYVLGLLGILGDNYNIKSNRESGEGRYDILLLPQDITKYGVIIEIKQLDKTVQKKTIEHTLVEALEQIETNQYYRELLAHNIKKRIEMAIVFVGKSVFIEVR